MKTENEIRLAVCAKFIKQDLQALETSLREEEQTCQEGKRPLWQNMADRSNHQINSKTITTMKKKTIAFISVAAAACCALVIGLHINRANWAETAFRQGIDGTQIFVSRGDNKVDSELQNAYQLMFAGQFRESDRVLKDLTQTINSTKPATEEEEQILKVQRDEQQWLHALSLLGQGKYRKAKKMLKQIASENGTFAQQAEQLLEQK